MYMSFNSNLTGFTCGAGTADPFRASEFTTVFRRVRVAWYLVFCVMFCRSLFVLWFFFCWSLCCLSFDLRLLITPLVSSNSSSQSDMHHFYFICIQGRICIFAVLSDFCDFPVHIKVIANSDKLCQKLFLSMQGTSWSIVMGNFTKQLLSIDNKELG
jgi:hypothetical protein